MKKELWEAVDNYLSDSLIPDDSTLDAALQASDAAGLPEINVTPNQGRLLHLIARIRGAKRILEIGTLGGYSTIWLARALPADGRLVTLELDPDYAAVAQKNLLRAGVADRVEVRVGLAVESLASLDREHVPPFDFLFIDADKESNPEYFAGSMKLVREGSVIVIDNVVRDGAIVADSDDAAVTGTQQVLQTLARHPRIDATAIQTVGSKGYDGFALAIVTE